MKHSLVIILVAALGFGAGSLTAGLLEAYRHANSVSQTIITASSARIAEAANTLTLLRRGQYAVIINDKEDLLSHEVFALSSALSPQTPVNREPLQALRMARRYREQHPFRTGESNVDQQVEKVLASLPSK